MKLTNDENAVFNFLTKLTCIYECSQLRVPYCEHRRGYYGHLVATFTVTPTLLLNYGQESSLAAETELRIAKNTDSHTYGLSWSMQNVSLKTGGNLVHLYNFIFRGKIS